ncbi:AraC-like transcriptional regulator QhpR [Gluconacetobacter tumulisoli]|uniref:AraC family transcriptional regulator n=1 Tax=Gluconacetobacter tumulisoli TaxID=1286189 RepID=A0A7W4K9D9_9PROT|nr:AraC family transcriptional regulator [Gluconacetobacter tumulisoli]MBB2202773.1 AraC family transcriptional regulator [Gluconacetobacter tumulisoli]
MDTPLHSAFPQDISGSHGGHRGVLAAAATGLEHFIKAQGGNPERVLATSGIDPDVLSSPTQSLGLVNYCRVMEEAARNSGQGNFGLHYGRQFRPQALGLIGYIGLTSPTLEAALRNIAEDFRWHQHDTMTRLVDRGECWHFEYQIRHGAILSRRQDAELSLGMFLNLVRSVLGPTWAPRDIHFEHPRPEQWHDHRRIFDAPVWFDQPCNALVIPKRDLLRPMPDNDPTLLLVMRETIRRLNGTIVSQTLVERTRAYIGILLPQGEVTLEDVARRTGLTPWALQRRLKEEGATFLSLVDAVRCELATHYMRQNSLAVSEMALLLGYSEISAFSRAFRRWFGISPRQWRKARMSLRD